MLAVIAMAAQDTTKPPDMPPMGPPQEIKDVAYLVGDWDMVGQMRQDTTQPWQEIKGSCTFSYTAGGAAMMMDYTGTMEGNVFQGVAIDTYDRETKKWQSIWIDNLSARITYYEGEKKDGQSVLIGEDRYLGQIYTIRLTSTKKTDKSFDWKMEMSTDGGKTFTTTMTTTYTKK